MKWQFLLSLRYFRERRKERFISVTAFISILGIAAGVAALIVTMGIMNGFNSEIEEKILSVNPHLIIGRDGPMADSKELMTLLNAIDGVAGSAEFMDGQAVINVRDKVMGVLVRGIQDDTAKRLVRVDSYLISGTSKLDPDGVLIGSELARHFRLKEGDTLSIISPMNGQKKEFRINGVFNSGRYDYDFTLLFMNLDEAKSLLGGEGITSGIGLKVRNVFDVDRVKHAVISFIKPPYWVITWKEIDKNLFSALKLEKIVMFLLLTLIICVACISVISTLIMTVMEKTKDIGILKAIGVTRSGILSVFLLEGLYISIMGIFAGAALGLGLCYLQSEYKLVKLPADVYYIHSVPVSVSLPDTLIIIASAFVLALAAALYPSLHAGRLNPVDALRCE